MCELESRPLFITRLPQLLRVQVILTSLLIIEDIHIFYVFRMLYGMDYLNSTNVYAFELLFNLTLGMFKYFLFNESFWMYNIIHFKYEMKNTYYIRLCFIVHKTCTTVM